MKMKLILGVFLSLGMALAASGQIVNGSFENGTDPGSYTTIFGVNNTAITGWTVNGGGSVDYIGTYWQSSDGSRNLDMSGLYTVGSISQTFATTPGVTYSISFDLSGNPDGPPANKTLVVNATGGGNQIFAYDVITHANNHADMQWEGQTYTFRATGANTTLTFSTPDSSAWGPALDNVGISALYGTVCHRDNGKKGQKTLTIGADAVPAHLAHGDTAGPCVTQPA